MATVAVLTVGLGFLATAVAQPLAPRPLPSSSVVEAADGSLLGHVGPVFRTPVPSSAIPRFLKAAVVATEDHTFYKNVGFDPKALARAALADLRARRVVQGGSTITQQLARTLFLSQEKTLFRKAREIYLALRLSRTLTKDEILTLYLNAAYFGEGAYGVEAASETYFGRPLQNLTHGEQALLAGLLRAPSAIDPTQHLQRALRRRHEVLIAMVRTGVLRPAEALSVDAETPRLRPGSAASGWPVLRAREELGNLFPDLARRIKEGTPTTVHLTLDPRLQRLAEETVQKQSRRLPQGAEVALVAMDPRSGAIRAIVGGRVWKPGAFDLASKARRTVASTFKPIVYATAFDQGLAPSTRVEGGPVVLPGKDGGDYRPKGGQADAPGPVSLRRALATSSNWVPVRLAEELGIHRVRSMARALGWHGGLPGDMTLALGSASAAPVDLAGLYAAFANGGFRVTPHILQWVKEKDGVLLAEGPGAEGRAVSSGVAYLVVSSLQSVVTEGTARSVGLPDGTAAKTGTADDMTDAWLVSMTPGLVVTAWVGGGPPLPGDGAHMAAPFVRPLLKAAGGPGNWPQPSDIVRVSVSTQDGLLANGSDPTTEEVFLKGKEPTKMSPLAPAAQGAPPQLALFFPPPEKGQPPRQASPEEAAGLIDRILRHFFGDSHSGPPKEEKTGADVRKETSNRPRAGTDGDHRPPAGATSMGQASGRHPGLGGGKYPQSSRSSSGPT